MGMDTKRMDIMLISGQVPLEIHLSIFHIHFNFYIGHAILDDMDKLV